MAFADTWGALQVQLSRGTTIQNWTTFSGDIGKPFSIEEVSAEKFTVRPEGAELTQSVRRRDLGVVYERWDDYVKGGFPREGFNDLTRVSKYAISILHWLQGQSGGRLP